MKKLAQQVVMMKEKEKGKQ
jgi:hypothetical protein